MDSPTFTEIKKAVDGMNTAFEAFKQTNDERIEALKSGNTTKARELEAKLATIEQDVSQFSTLKKSLETQSQIARELKERLEDLEGRADRPAKTAGQKRASEYKEAFVAWLRNKGQSPVDEQKLIDIQRKMIDAKDVTIGSSAGGGYAVPEEIARTIEVLEKKYSPVRNLVKVVQTGTSDYKELVNVRGATAGWVGETGSRSATPTPQLREVVPTFGELYAYPQASEWSLDDIFFNVEQWLADEVASEFAIAEGDAVITGSGTSKPTGMLNTAPVTTDDFASPLRAAAAYQYIAATNSPVGVDADSLITLMFKLNSAYRANATWVMNSVTTGAVRKLKDTTGQYLWQPGLQAGVPNMLLGRPIETWEQLDDIGSNKFPVAIGDFKRGYVLADRVGLRITRDNVTNVGFVRFYIRRREGGIVLNNDAIKWIKTT
jgi:HK97 family phage major capsid protein